MSSEIKDQDFDLDQIRFLIILMYLIVKCLFKVWSDELAESSQSWAESCKQGHSQTPGLGENGSSRWGGDGLLYEDDGEMTDDGHIPVPLQRIESEQ